jgi:hypothetical protein
MRFADLLKRDGETPAAIEAAIARAQQAAAEAVARMEELGKRRRAALLADDDKALDAIERDLQLATRDRDRASLAKLELLDRLQAAQKAERQARVDAIHAEGLKARDAAAAIIKGRYRKLSAELVGIAQELQRLDTAVQDVNRRLTAEGDPRRVADVDTVARPQSGHLPMMAVPVHAGLRLPDPGDSALYVWPPDADVLGLGSGPRVVAALTAGVPPREAA